MGSPQPATKAQYATLEQAGQLQMLGAPQRVRAERGEMSLTFRLPRQGVSLLEIVYE